MRRILLATATAVAVISAVGLDVRRADAMTLAAPIGLRAAIDSTNLAENVRWVCRYHWNGRRSCWWEPGYYRQRYWRHRRW
jgi:hypothetical protein